MQHNAWLFKFSERILLGGKFPERLMTSLDHHGSVGTCPWSLYSASNQDIVRFNL